MTTQAIHLTSYGWGPKQDQWQEEHKEYTLGRILLEHKRLYRVITAQGEVLAAVSGKFQFEAIHRSDFPAVGDWVLLSLRPEEERGTIHHVLPRVSQFSRNAAGRATEEQLVAVNVDTVFLVHALNQDFNIRRVERYLVLAWESGATPVIILSKSDLCEDPETKLREVSQVAIGVPIHIISAEQDQGFEALGPYLQPGRTIALLGSSGVGKSTLTNKLLGHERQLTQTIRDEDGKGRHTTTYRELIPLPQGSCIIDTPGMRELQLWSADEGLSGTFEDVEELATQCYFHDCTHQSEPNCAVQQALADGTLDADRMESYWKLQRELAFLARKEDKQLALAERNKWKKRSQAAKSHAKRR